MVKATKAARILSPRSSWSQAKFFHRRLTSKRNTGQPLTNLCNYEFLSDSGGRRRRRRGRRRRTRRRTRRRRREEKKKKIQIPTIDQSVSRNDCNEFTKGFSKGWTQASFQRGDTPRRVCFLPRVCPFARNMVGKTVVVRVLIKSRLVLERCINGNWISTLHAVNQLYLKGEKSKVEGGNENKKQKRERERKRKKSAETFAKYVIRRTRSRKQRILFDVNHFESNCTVNKNMNSAIFVSTLNFVSSIKKREKGGER